MTVSIGVAALSSKNTDVASPIKAVDENLYRAKREGRNRVVA